MSERELTEEPNENIAMALDSIATALRNLGNGNAATEMGAIEAASLKIKEGLDAVAEAIVSLADAVDRHGA